MLHVTEARALAHMTKWENNAVIRKADEAAGCYNQANNNIRPAVRGF